jgi:hypothetical protein
VPGCSEAWGQAGYTGKQGQLQEGCVSFVPRDPPSIHSVPVSTSPLKVILSS